MLTRRQFAAASAGLFAASLARAESAPAFSFALITDTHLGKSGADYSKRMADAVTETEPVMADDVLGNVPIGDLLTVPVHVLAERWRGRGDAPPA